MAQLGCHVPAEAATVRIPDKVLARVSNRDSIEGNSSTFRTEMEETAFILNNIGPTSIVIIDELGRGTSVDEGFAICYAVAERLLTGSSGFIFLATHFRQMTRLAELHPCAANHHFLSETGSSTHRLVPGKAPDSDLQYGIELAARSLPRSVVEQARVFRGQIVQEGEVGIRPEQQLDSACLFAVAEMKRLYSQGLRGAELKEALKRIKEKLIREGGSGQGGRGSAGGGEMEENLEMEEFNPMSF